MNSIEVEKMKQFIGKPVTLWIEDVSGEEKTKPRTYTLQDIQAVEGKEILFFIGPGQFLSVPWFEEDVKLMLDCEKPYFLTEDKLTQLLYWVYFEI